MTQADRIRRYAVEHYVEPARREGRPRFTRLRRENAEHPIESVGKELRGMMSFLKDAD